MQSSNLVLGRVNGHPKKLKRRISRLLNKNAFMLFNFATILWPLGTPLVHTCSSYYWWFSQILAASLTSLSPSLAAIASKTWMRTEYSTLLRIHWKRRRRGRRPASRSATNETPVHIHNQISSRILVNSSRTFLFDRSTRSTDWVQTDWTGVSVNIEFK